MIDIPLILGKPGIRKELSFLVVLTNEKAMVMRRHKFPVGYNTKLIFPNNMVYCRETHIVKGIQYILQVVPPGEDIHASAFLQNPKTTRHPILCELIIFFLWNLVISFQNPRANPVIVGLFGLEINRERGISDYQINRVLFHRYHPFQAVHIINLVGFYIHGLFKTLHHDHFKG